MDWLLSHGDWLKAFHVIFVVCWFACLFYLPRLFINHVIAEEQVTKDRLYIMQRKLLRFSIPFAVLTVATGLLLFIAYSSYYLSAKWFYLKVLLVGTLIVYHIICGFMVSQFSQNKNRFGHVFYRWFNEYPTIVLFAAVILVEVRPF